MSELITQSACDRTTERINNVFNEIGIERAELTQLDHLCYRTETLDEYRAVLTELKPLGRSLGEVMVQGRPIDIIALDEPIQTNGWTVDFLEIAAPKASSPYPSGLEHAEFVTGGLLTDFHARHAELEFITDAMQRVINPELKYRKNGISVKFHQLNVGAVVQIERRAQEQGVSL